MATITSDNFPSKNLLDTFYATKIGKCAGFVLAKIEHLVGENDNVRISNDHLINSLAGLWKKTSLKNATKQLKELGFIDKTPGYVRDAQGRIIASYNDYTVNRDNISKFMFPDGKTTEGQKTATPTVTPLLKDLAISKEVFEEKVVSKMENTTPKPTRLIPIEDFPIEENLQIIKERLMRDGIECDSVEHEMRKMTENYSNPEKSRIASVLQKAGQKFMVCLKGFYSLFKRWIISGKTNNTQEHISLRLNNKKEKDEEMAKAKKETIDPYKIESEMRYEIYNEKSETIKTLRFKILELATPSTYKAWFKDIIFETCFNDDNYDYAFIPRSNFIKDKFDTDPKLNGILKAFKIKMAA